MNNDYTKSVNHDVMHLINVTNYLIRSRPDKGSPFQSGVSVSVFVAILLWRRGHATSITIEIFQCF